MRTPTPATATALALAALLALASVAAAVAPPSLIHALRRTRLNRAAGRAATHPDMRACYDKGQLVLDYVTDSATGAHATARAKKGWKVISGGADARAESGVDGAGGFLSASFPLAGDDGVPNAWRASAGEGKQVEASAVLLYDPDDRWEVALFHASAYGSDDLSATARLPAGEGYVLVGAGGKVAGARGVYLRGVELVGDDGVRASAPAGCGNGAESHVTAYAVGLRRAGHDVHTLVKKASGTTAGDDDDDGASMSVSAQVPAELRGNGFAVTAAGAIVSDDDGCAAFLDALKPTVYGEEAAASAHFAAGGGTRPAGDALSMSACMVEGPAIFY